MMPNKQRMKSWGVIAARAPPTKTPTEKRGGEMLSKVSYLNPAEGGTTHTQSKLPLSVIRHLNACPERN